MDEVNGWQKNFVYTIYDDKDRGEILKEKDL